jgi:hypothetical protein
MRRPCIVTLALALALATPARGGWHGAVALGQALRAHVWGAAPRTSANRGAHVDSSLSFQGSAGYAARYLGLEVGYETIGRVQLAAVSDGSGARSCRKG